MPTAAIGITASFTISTKRKRYGQSSSQVAVRGTRNESGPKVLNFSICCNRLHPCMFVCFAQFVSFWCSPIMSNIVYCCLCDIYLTKSKKRPRHRCVTPSKTSVKQYARAVSLFWLVFLSLFCLFVLQMFVDIVCHTIDNICVLCEVAFGTRYFGCSVMHHLR